MVPDVDLKEIERKVWTSYFQDGLWDIFFGLLFAIGAVLWELLGNPIGPIAFSVSGSATLLFGLVLLARLLRKYPKPPQELSDSDE